MSSTEKPWKNTKASLKVLQNEKQVSEKKDSAGSGTDFMNDFEVQTSLRDALIRERKFKIEYERERSKNETLEKELSTLSSTVLSLRTQLDSSNQTTHELLQKYDELYKASRYAIQQAESQNDHLKKELEKSFDNSEADQLLTEIQKEEQHLRSQLLKVQTELSEVKNQAEAANQTEIAMKLEKAHTVAELRKVAEVAIFQSVQLGGIRDQIHSSLRMMESLLQSMRDSTSGWQDTKANGINSKAQTILMELLKLEVEKIRKIDLQIADIMQTSKNLKTRKWD